MKAMPFLLIFIKFYHAMKYGRNGVNNEGLFLFLRIFINSRASFLRRQDCNRYLNRLKREPVPFYMR